MPLLEKTLLEKVYEQLQQRDGRLCPGIPRNAPDMKCNQMKTMKIQIREIDTLSNQRP